MCVGGIPPKCVCVCPCCDVGGMPPNEQTATRRNAAKQTNNQRTVIYIYLYTYIYIGGMPPNLKNNHKGGTPPQKNSHIGGMPPNKEQVNTSLRYKINTSKIGNPDTTGYHPDTTGYHRIPPGYQRIPAGYCPDTTGYHPDTARILADTTRIPPDTTRIPPDTARIPPDTTRIPPDTTRIPPGYHRIPPGYHRIPPGYHPDTTGYHPDTTGYHTDTAGYHPDTSGYHPDTTCIFFGLGRCKDGTKASGNQRADARAAMLLERAAGPRAGTARFLRLAAYATSLLNKQEKQTTSWKQLRKLTSTSA